MDATQWAAQSAAQNAAGAWAAQQGAPSQGMSPSKGPTWGSPWPAPCGATQIGAELALAAVAGGTAAAGDPAAASPTPPPPQALSMVLPARPPTYVFVSDSHLWLRVMRAAARREGLRVHADPRARIDTGALVQALLSRAQPFHASSPVSVSIYGVGVPRVDSVWMGAWELGVRTRFRPPRTEDEARGVRRVEPDMLVDAAVVIGAASQVCAPGSCPGRMILVTGDASVQPLVEAAVAKGWFVAVAAPRDSPALAHAFACGGAGIVLEDLVAAATVTHLCVQPLGMPVPASFAFEAEGVVPEVGLQYDQLCSGVARALTIATRLPWQARVAPCPRRGGALAVLAVVQVGTTSATLEHALASAAATEGGAARGSGETRDSDAVAPDVVPEPRGSTTAAAGVPSVPVPGGEDARRQSWADRVKAALTNRSGASAPNVPPGEAATPEDDDLREAGVQARGEKPASSPSVPGTSLAHASDSGTGDARPHAGVADHDHATGTSGVLDAAGAFGADIDPGALLEALKTELAKQKQRVQRARDAGEPLPPPNEVALVAVGLRGLRPWTEGLVSLPSRSGSVQVVAAGPAGPATPGVRDRATAELERGAHKPSDAPLLCALPEPQPHPAGAGAASVSTTVRAEGDAGGGGGGAGTGSDSLHLGDYPFLVASGGGIGDEAIASIATGMRPPLVGEHDEEEVPRCWNADRCPYALGCRFAHSADDVRHFLARAAANALGWKLEPRTARGARGARASASERRGRAVQHGAWGRGRQPQTQHRGGGGTSAAQAARPGSFLEANADVNSGTPSQPDREGRAASIADQNRASSPSSAAAPGATTSADGDGDATDAALRQTARTLSMIFEASGSWASVAGGGAPAASANASQLQFDGADVAQTLRRSAKDVRAWETSAHVRPLPPRGRGRRGRGAHRSDGSSGNGGARGRGWGRGRGRGRGNMVWNRAQQAQQQQQ